MGTEMLQLPETKPPLWCMYSTQEWCFNLSTSGGLTAIRQKLVLHQERRQNQLYCPQTHQCYLAINNTGGLRCLSEDKQDR